MEKAEIITQLQNTLSSSGDAKELHSKIAQFKSDYKKSKDYSYAKKLEEFVSGGGASEDFVYSNDEEDDIIADLFTKAEIGLQAVRDSEFKNETDRVSEKEGLINQIKKLVNTDRRGLKSGYDKVRDIQAKWKATGPNKSKALRDLESQFKYNVDLFYHNAKITKQFIELDFDKNLNSKNAIVQKIKDLSELADGGIIEKKINQYQKEWHRVGPVKREVRDEAKKNLEASINELNPRIEQFYAERSELLEENLKQKVVLCDKINAIREETLKSPKEYQQRTDAIIKIQNQWREIGRSKDNEKVWKLFREGCDAFFDKKRTFFGEISSKRKENKTKKLELIKAVEAVKESEDWKKTSSEIIQIQKTWKTIGPAQQGEDQKLWRRFRSACDAFFNAKSKHFEKQDSSFKDNLVAKKALIEKIEAHKNPDAKKDALDALREFETKWQGIGFVPFKTKNEINGAYKKAMSAHYSALNLNAKQKEELRFSSKMKSLISNDNSGVKYERRKLKQQIQRLEQEAQQYRNNLSRFTGHENNPIIKSIHTKIKKAETQMKKVEDKLVLLNDLENQAEFAKKQAEKPSEKEEE